MFILFGCQWRLRKSLRTRLAKKLATSALHPDITGFLASWLDDRSSEVVIGGAASPAELLPDSVYQGTVLGPLLWDVYFADARRALVHQSFVETTFADDLNAWRAFRLDRGVAVPHEEPLTALRGGKWLLWKDAEIDSAQASDSRDEIRRRRSGARAHRPI